MSGGEKMKIFISLFRGGMSSAIVGKALQDAAQKG